MQDDPKAGPGGGHAIEAPFHLGHESERPLRSHDEVESIAGAEVGIQRKARRVLGGARETQPDQLARLADGGRRVALEAGECSGVGAGRKCRRGPGVAGEPRHVAVGGDERDALHPAAHAAVPKRAGAGSVGRDYPAGGGPAPAGRIGREAERVLGRQGLELAQRGPRPHPRPTLRRPNLETGAVHAGEVHHDAVAHIAPAHGASCAPGNERDPLGRRPADQLDQVVDVGGERHGAGDDAIDAGPLGVRGPGSLVGSEQAAQARLGGHMQS